MSTFSEIPHSATVMVVDDVPANIGVLLDALHLRYRLCVAESAESCLEQLPHADPDLILLDVNMPAMDGFALCEHLQQDERWRQVPIIFMTVLDHPEEKRRALHLGAVDFVTKPIYVPEVEARVSSHLRLRFLQRDLELRNEQLADEVAMRRETESQLQQSLNQALISVQPDGQVTFITRLAESLLQRYFGRSGSVMLPPELLVAWQDHATSAHSATWTLPHQSGRARLEVRAHPSGGGILFQLSEIGRRGPALLATLGLSSRECEVLYWVAEGKSNAEIATILGTALRTVHKHMENIFRKLHLESRASAMRLALDTLGEHQGT